MDWAAIWLSISDALPGIFTPLFSAFAGAFFGYLTAEARERADRAHRAAAAGNLAIFQLSRMLDDFLKIKRAIEEYRAEILADSPYAPLWFQMKPMLHRFAAVDIDYAGLSFLIERGQPEILNAVHQAQICHSYLATWVDQHARLSELAQERLAASGHSPYEPIAIGALNHALGVVLKARLESVIGPIFDSIANDQQKYRDAAQQLTAAVKEAFPKSKAIRLQ